VCPHVGLEVGALEVGVVVLVGTHDSVHETFLAALGFVLAPLRPDWPRWLLTLHRWGSPSLAECRVWGHLAGGREASRGLWPPGPPGGACACCCNAVLVADGIGIRCCCWLSGQGKKTGRMWQYVYCHILPVSFPSPAQVGLQRLIYHPIPTDSPVSGWLQPHGSKLY